MANATIPVPTDLQFERTLEELGILTFTSVRDDLLYDVRFSHAPAFWEEKWSRIVGPYPAGTVVRVELRFPLALVAYVGPVAEEGVEPAPPEVPPPGDGLAYFFIAAKDPSIPVPNNWSYIWPGPDPDDITAGTPGTEEGGNWGQGGLRVEWGEWVEPEPVAPVPVQPFGFSPVRAGDTGVRLRWTPIDALPVRFIVTVQGGATFRTGYLTEKSEIFLGLGRGLAVGETFYVQSQTMRGTELSVLEPEDPGQLVTVGPAITVEPPPPDPEPDEPTVPDVPDEPTVPEEPDPATVPETREAIILNERVKLWRPLPSLLTPWGRFGIWVGEILPNDQG